jgi:WD40 repeat protein
VTGEKIVVTPNGRYMTRVHSVSFSPDGRKIVSGSGDMTVQIWDAQTGINILSLRRLSGAPLSVVFSRDSKRIAVTGSTAVEVRDVNSGILIWKYPESRYRGGQFVAFSLGTQRIISVYHGVVDVLNGDTGALEAGPSMQHAEGALALEFNSKSEFEAVAPNGKWMADNGCGHYKVRIVDSKTGQVVVTYEGHTKHVRNIAFSPDSKRVLSASDDRTIQVHTLNL